ncbi:unnamed protein product [Microthlaspi erraticum]|uniref:FBD domain-containing protein n=1 Tax=Microthlaspi erraticum TaxID=1685480 RepID=A0A6D2KQZ6_9BRAS|nr:unnamed protein product [Microthlaspi erraticum]
MANISGVDLLSSSLVEEDGVKIISGEDRISLLPESLQCHILSFLATQETVRTSVLSSAWRHLWAQVPIFEIESSKFLNDEACVEFIDKFLNIQSESCLEGFDLVIGKDDSKKDASLYEPCLGKLISRKIQRFGVRCCRNIEMPLTLPSCEALVYLYLFSVRLNDFESLSLPSLKRMFLEDVIFPTDTSPNWVLDTPRLKHLIFKDNQFKSFKIISMRDSVKVFLDVEFEIEDHDLSERNIIYNLLNNFSDVRDLTLTRNTLQMITCLHHLNPLPKFRNLTRLRVTMFLNSSTVILPLVLESCPKLKHLRLRLIIKSNTLADTSLPSKLPSCLVSSLECVELRSHKTDKEIERKLVRYFMDNATKLKKFVLQLCVYREEPDIFGLSKLKFDADELCDLKQHFDSPRRSNLCQFEILPFVLKRPISSS